MKNESQISCPSCGTQIDVNDILKHQLEESLRKEYGERELAVKKEIHHKEERLKKEKEAFQIQKEKDAEAFQEKLNATLYYKN